MATLAIPFPMIDPVAFSVGPLSIKWYGLAYVVGLLGGWFYARRLVGNSTLWGDRKRPTPDDLDDLLVWVAIGIVVGGRLGHVLFYDLERYLAAPLTILATWQGGMSFHGGLIGAAMSLWLFARRRGHAALSMFDIVSTVVPIGLFFGRLANFVNGELWGRPAPNFAYAIIFPDAGPVPRHPSQLYEAATEGLLLFILLALIVRRVGFRKPGFISGIFAIGYALARIFCEFFREPDAQLGYLFGNSVNWLGGGITMGMILSLPMLLIGALLVLKASTSDAPPRQLPST
jgi:phosphatidylglycerol---prolipoprotein diacylglyceryl transferase